MIVQPNGNDHGSGSGEPMKVAVSALYATEISASASDEDATSNNKNGGIFRSNAARALLIISSLALILFALLSPSSPASTTANLKELSDRVVDLTRQLQSVGSKDSADLAELDRLRHDLDDKDIELAWEKQHVDNQKDIQRLMQESMVSQIQADQHYLEEYDHKLNGATAETHKIEMTLAKEQRDNAQLKHALQFALEELARAREGLPPAPERKSGENGGNGNGQGNKTEKKLRGPGAGYQPGDNIEIIEHEDSGKIALRPGIISGVNPDGTYHLVKLEQSILIKNKQRSDFQTYHVYWHGMSALYQETRDNFIPITIVEFVPKSAREGFEIHGKYLFTFDSDEAKTIQMTQAMRIHRYASPGEYVGDDEAEREEAQ